MSAVVLFLGRRLLFALLLVFVVSSGSLLLAHLAPGDYTSALSRPGVSPETVARERERLGLDRPLAEQYVAWLGRLVGSIWARRSDTTVRSPSWSGSAPPTRRFWRPWRCCSRPGSGCRWG